MTPCTADWYGLKIKSKPTSNKEPSFSDQGNDVLELLIQQSSLLPNPALQQYNQHVLNADILPIFNFRDSADFKIY
jgi:hypothetical protein